MATDTGKKRYFKKRKCTRGSSGGKSCSAREPKVVYEGRAGGRFTRGKNGRKNYLTMKQMKHVK